MKTYLLLADGNSPHTLKWAKALQPYFKLSIISLNGISSKLETLIGKEDCYILNTQQKQAGQNYKLIMKLLAIRTIIKKLQPDIINAHFLSSYGLLAALSHKKAPKAKVIMSAWGSDVLVTPFRNKLNYKLLKYTLQEADIVTSDALTMSNVIKSIAPQSDISTFAFGLETIETYSGEKEDLIFSNRTLVTNSNISQILQWFAKQPTNYRLVIANDGDQREALTIETEKLSITDRVHFVGFISSQEQEEYYKKGRYYLSIPSSDATSVSLLEAMQYGMIAIVSDIPANREWIEDGTNGLFFDPNSQVDSLKVAQDFATINQDILRKKAHFPSSIKTLVDKVNS